jgi:hypothetical protein
MTHFKPILVILLTFNALTLFAQIEKGNYSLGGETYLWLGLNQGSGSYKNTTFNAAISPSISKFVNDRFLLGVRPTLYAYTQMGSYNVYNTNKVTITTALLGLDVSGRYYVKKMDNIHLFAFGKTAYDFFFAKDDRAIVGPMVFFHFSVTKSVWALIIL